MQGYVIHFTRATKVVCHICSSTQTKFEVRSFTDSKDMIWVRKLIWVT